MVCPLNCCQLPWLHCCFNSYFLMLLFMASSGNHPNFLKIAALKVLLDHSVICKRFWFYFWHSGHIFWTKKKKKALTQFGSHTCISGNNREDIWNWNMLGNLYHVLTIITGFGQENQSDWLTKRLVNHQMRYHICIGFCLETGHRGCFFWKNFIM